MAATVSAPRKSLAPWLFDSVQFYQHQIDGVRQLLTWRSFLLADDMGLGKSLQALTVFCADIATGNGETCIVVCPVSLRGNWADEIEKFTNIPYMLLGEELNTATGGVKTLGPGARSVQLIEFSTWKGPKILIVNYEQVAPHLAELNAMPWRAAIFDEAHNIKNHLSKRAKACIALKSDRSFLLTGTPVLNQVNELWVLLHKISPNNFKNYYAFVNRYCVFGGWKSKQIVGVKNMRELQGILQKVMLRRLKSEVLDLPEVQCIEKMVDLHPEQRKIYDQVYNEMELASIDPNGPPERIEHALTVFLRLKQICGTPATLGHPDNSYKMDAIVGDAEEVIGNGHKLVVFTQFRGIQEVLAKRFADAGLPVVQLHGDVPKPSRQDIVKDWGKSPNAEILLCMSQVAGIGLNMTAARHAFFADELFVPGLNQQCVDRLHRIGQSETQPVQVTKYISRGTIDQRIQQILRTKTKLFVNVIEGVGVVQKLLQALRGGQ